MKTKTNFALVVLFATMLLTVPVIEASGQNFSAVNADGKTIFYNVKSSSVPYSVELVRPPEEFKYSGDINIPETVEYEGKTYTVKSIAFGSAFSGNQDITSISLPNTIGSPDIGTFSGCSGLTSVKLPNSIGVIQIGLFSGCRSLKSIEIPNTVRSIGSNAFSGCKSLVSLKLPASLENMELNPFTGCSSLTEFQIDESNANYCTLDGVLFNKSKSIIIACPGGKEGKYSIPNNTLNIGGYSFSDCKKLTSLIIPSSVSDDPYHALWPYKINYSTFSDCISLTEFIVDKDNRSIGSFDGVLYSKYIKKLIICPRKKAGACIIPDYIVNIGNNAFSNCTELTSITIPSSVGTISSGAFSGCAGLVEIYSMATIPPTASDAFSNFSATLYVPEGSKAAYQNADGWKNFTNIVEKVFNSIEDNIADNSNISVTIANGYLIISGADENANIQVYNTSGSLLYNTTVSDAGKINLPHGMLIVTISGKSYKVTN